MNCRDREGTALLVLTDILSQLFVFEPHILGRQVTQVPDQRQALGTGRERERWPSSSLQQSVHDRRKQGGDKKLEVGEGHLQK